MAVRIFGRFLFGARSLPKREICKLTFSGKQSMSDHPISRFPVVESDQDIDNMPEDIKERLVDVKEKVSFAILNSILKCSKI